MTDDTPDPDVPDTSPIPEENDSRVPETLADPVPDDAEDKP